ncbi:predicted protein [Chaetoceros tenuissimus]|uniref:Uncharacterized protein n=1 Tax=Chaetoceros tenuissimus TaxID=426638 RepID=A0AAD3D3Q1_9STRA|nr:predicted protein [Chaetoceros tenuissimus]
MNSSYSTSDNSDSSHHLDEFEFALDDTGALSIIQEEEPMFHEDSDLSEFMMDDSFHNSLEMSDHIISDSNFQMQSNETVDAPMNEVQPNVQAPNFQVPAIRRPSFLCLMSPEDLEKQREETINRLSQYMERSAKSRVNLTSQLSVLSPNNNDDDSVMDCASVHSNGTTNPSSILGSVGNGSFQPQQLAATYTNILANMTWV